MRFIEIGRGIDTELDETPDPEGRVLVTRHGNFTCINMYLPNGSSSPQRQHYKDRWLEDMLVWSQDFLRDSNPVVLCGDLNIAHNENDIWNPTGNRGTLGFLDHEREWFDRLLKSGWKDLVRSHYGERKGPYSWWSNRGRARELDRGLEDRLHPCQPSCIQTVCVCRGCKGRRIEHFRPRSGDG